MKTLSAGLAAHLAGGITTLCTCWRVTRADGVKLGFTDHDRPIAFAGVEHEPATGLDGSEAVAHAGLQVGGFDVAGAFTSDRLNEADLRAGLYDNARVETWLVNWANPAERHLLRVGEIGEVRREGSAFTAEVRGLAHRLDQDGGRLFRFTCDADLGDGRCKVDLDLAEWRAEGEVLEGDGATFIRAELSAERPAGLFDGGVLRFTSGANAARRIEVLRHAVQDGEAVFDLWEAMAAPIAPGDGFTVTAGGDKRFATCRDRFNNIANFRGFPHMPGNDFALSYARRDGENQGERLAD